MQTYGQFILAGIAGLALLVIVRRVISKRFAFPYQQRDSLFTPAERHFLSYLRSAVGEDALIFGKVRVADVLKPWDRLPGKRWHQAFHPISSKHFDYVLCDPDDLFVVCVIELNDSSHDNPERQQRDDFLRQSCAAAGLPLIEIPAKSRYVVKHLRSQLEEYL